MYFKVQLKEGGRVPQRREDSAGYDCYSRVDGVINPLSFVKVPLGFAAEFDPKYVCLLMDRSSMGGKGVTRFGGVIDASYRGEWMAVLYNTGPQPLSFAVGTAVIQGIFLPIGLSDVEIVDMLGESSRGEGGFGSTEKRNGS